MYHTDENSGSRPSGSSNSTSQSDATTQESNQNTDSTITLTPDHESPEILESSVTITIMIIGVMGGLIAILVLTTVVVSLTVLCLIQQRKLKSIITDDNPADDGMWLF